MRLPAPPLPDWLDRMLPGFERSLVEVDDVRLHVMEAGPKTGLPVVMLHGNPTWGFLWRKVVAELPGVRVILPDILGLGLSDHPRDASVHTLDHHAQLMGRLFDRIVPGRLVFVGQDWGGPIGLRALADRSDRVAGLVILNTAVSPPRPDFRPTLFHRLAQAPVISDAIFRGLGFPQNALWFAQGDRSSIRGDVARAYRWPLRGLKRNLAPLALARMVPDSHEHPSIEPLRHCQQLVESFKGPAAIVWGDRDPVLGRVRTWVEKLLPQAKVTKTQAGHFLQEEVPSEIASAVRSVVESAS
jgi:cis-3-alkyl-4-acyloxetan-2-one decarboxylase